MWKNWEMLLINTHDNYKNVCAKIFKITFGNCSPVSSVWQFDTFLVVFIQVSHIRGDLKSTKIVLVQTSFLEFIFYIMNCTQRLFLFVLLLATIYCNWLPQRSEYSLILQSGWNKTAELGQAWFSKLSQFFSLNSELIV